MGSGPELVWVGQVNSYQRRLINAYHQHDRVAGITGVSTGKTTGGALLAFAHLAVNPPGSRFLCVPPAYPTWRDPMLPAIKRVMCNWQRREVAPIEEREELGEDAWRAKYSHLWVTPETWTAHPMFGGFHKSEKRIKLLFPDGPRILLARTADKPKSIDGVTDLVGGWAEELRHWPKDGESWRVFITRQRLGEEARRKGASQFIYISTTPELGHWIEPLFKADPGEELVSGWHVLHGTMDDNDLMAEESRVLIKRELTGAAYDRLVNGLWVMAEGAVFGDVLGEDTWVGFEPDPKARCIWGVDFGTTPAVVGLQSEGEHHTIFYEIDNCNVPTTERMGHRWLSDVQQQGLHTPDTPGTVWYDPAGDSRSSANPTRESEVQQLRRIMPQHWKWKKLNSQESRSVSRGTQHVLGRFRNHAGERRLFISHKLKGRTRDTQSKPPQPATFYQSITGIEWQGDEPRKRQGVSGLDHFIDALRYAVVGETWTHAPPRSLRSMNQRLVSGTGRTRPTLGLVKEPGMPRR